MDITRTSMQELFTSFSMIFRDVYKKSVDEKYKQFSMEVTMGTSQVNLPLLEQITGMREWVGPREVNNLASQKLTMVARKFEQTFGVKKDDVEDDQYGVYRPLLEQMAVNAANLVPELVDDLFANATSQKWLDGAAFFGTGRKYGKNTIANYTTDALSYDSLNAAYLAMTTYKGHGNSSLRVRPNILLHGPALRTTVADLVKSPIRSVAVGETAAVTLPNPNANLLVPVELSGLAGNKWALAASGAGYKPVCVFMRRRPDNLVRLDRDDDSNVFLNGEFLYGSDGRAEVAFVLPHLIYFGNAS